MLKQSLALIGLTLSLGVNAASFNYTGVVTDATGAFSALTPIGTPLEGPIAYDDAAIALGLAGIADVESIDVNLGGFCFTTGADVSACPNGGALVPVTSIDSAAITFAGGQPTGGTMDITYFSSTFQVNIPILYDFTAGTFFSDGGALGTVSGTIQVVPLPAAAWLFISALGGLVVAKRKQLKA